MHRLTTTRAVWTLAPLLLVAGETLAQDSTTPKPTSPVEKSASHPAQKSKAAVPASKIAQPKVSRKTATPLDALAQPIKAEFTETSLRDALDFISEQIHCKIRHDFIEDELSVPITNQADGVTTDMFLQQVLTPLELTIRVRHDAIEVIPLERAAQIDVVSYPISDLLFDKTTEGDEFIGQNIIEFLREFAHEPENDNSEQVKLTIFNRTGILVVKANAHYHQTIRGLLAILREANSRSKPAPEWTKKVMEKQLPLRTNLDE